MKSSVTEEADSQAEAKENKTPDTTAADTFEESNQTTVKQPQQSNNVITSQNNLSSAWNFNYIYCYSCLIYIDSTRTCNVSTSFAIY